MFGYRYVIDALKQQADIKLETAIDNKEYNDDDLVEIKVPLNMPYQDRVTGFERHYGEININGKVYSYVKMKLDRDTMVLKCIQNHGKQQLLNTADNLVKATNGQEQEHNGKQQLVTISKLFGGDYDDKNFTWNLYKIEIVSDLYRPDFTASLQDALIQIPDQPPRC
jgi:hypothetical protein